MLTVSDELLHGVVSGALERMAFVFVEQSELTNGEVLALSVAHAAISLRGAQGWTVTVSATAGLVQEVASGMMGCEPEDIDVDDHGRAGGRDVMQHGREGASFQVQLRVDRTTDSGSGSLFAVIGDARGERGSRCVVYVAPGHV